jgi:hypothetical protein
VVQDDDRVGGQVQVVADVVLASILEVRVPVAQALVEPEPILRVRLERLVWARPAIAVSEVDQEVRALVF